MSVARKLNSCAGFDWHICKELLTGDGYMLNDRMFFFFNDAATTEIYTE